MKACRIASGAAIATAFVAAAAGLAANAIDPGRALAQSSDVEAVVKDYFAQRPEEARRLVKDFLAKNSDVLQEAVAEKKQRDDRAALISSKAFAVFHSARQVVLGNPNGDVTLVEFVDYNCGFCRRALGDILDLVKSDANLRLVLMQYPVLGAGSVEAARVAVALQMQDGGPAKYLEFHSKLMAGPGPANKARALAVAAGLGIDMARLEADLARAEIEATLEENKRLGRALRIRGTPSYVICDRIVSGAVPAGILKTTITTARQAQQDSGARCEV
jgi:protein-disulfide isomerase